MAGVFVAIAPIMLAQRGLTGSKNPAILKTGDLVLASNLNFSEGNLVEKEGGSTKVNTTALDSGAKIISGHDWWPTGTTQRRVVALGTGKLLKDDMTGAFGTTLKTGLGTDKLTQFVDGGGEAAGAASHLFIPNGFDVVQVLDDDGATTHNLTTPPADWTGNNQPSFMFIFRGVLIGGGNANFPNQLYASTGGNHEDFVAAGSFVLSVYPRAGVRIVAGLTAFGRAFLWKFPRGIFWVDDSAAAVSGWFVKEASAQYGAAPTPHAVAQIDEAVVAFLSNTGNVVLMQESSGSLTGVAFTDLTKVLNLRQIVRDNFNLAHLSRAQVRWYDERKQLHVTFAAQGSTALNRRLVIDFNEEHTRVEITEKDIAEALWLERDANQIPRPIGGDNAGFVRKLDQVVRTIDGMSYPFSLQTAPTDFSDINPRYSNYKLFRALHLEYVPSGNFNVAVEVLIDGKQYGPVLFTMDTAGSTLPFPLPGVLGGEDLRRKTRDICGEGYYLSLRMTETGPNNPRLARAWAEFDLTSMSR